MKPQNTTSKVANSKFNNVPELLCIVEGTEFRRGLSCPVGWTKTPAYKEYATECLKEDLRERQLINQTRLQDV